LDQFRRNVTQFLGVTPQEPDAPAAIATVDGVLPAGGRTSPQPLSAAEALSNGEVRRRVDQAVQRARDRGDAAYLTGVVIFAETSRSIYPTHAKFTFEIPSRLGAFLGWLRQHYGDLVRDITVQVSCGAGTSALLVAAASRTFANAAGLKPEGLLRTHYLGRRESPMAPVGILTVHGRGISCILSGLAAYLRTQAKDHLAANQQLRGMAQGAILGDFLQALIHSCEVSPEPAPSDPVAQLIQPAISPAPAPAPREPTSVDAVLLPALSRRMDALFVSLSDGNSPPDPALLQAELRRLAKKGDTLGVAAAACMLWQQREMLPKSSHLSGFIAQAPETPTLREAGARQPRPYAAAPAAETMSAAPAASTVLVTTEQFASLIQYDVRTVRERLLPEVFVEGEHYTRGRGGRKILIFRDKALAFFTGQDK